MENPDGKGYRTNPFHFRCWWEEEYGYILELHNRSNATLLYQMVYVQLGLSSLWHMYMLHVKSVMLFRDAVPSEALRVIQITTSLV